MDRGTRLGCGLVVFLIFVAFTFGVLGGGMAAAGLLLVYTRESTAQPTPVVLAVSQEVLVPIAMTTSVQAQPLEEIAAVSAVRRVGPAVVTVINTLPPQRGFFGRVTQPEARGSGVIIDSAGHIITNNHVVENAQSLAVLLASGKRRDAKLVGTDTFTDLAVLQISGADLPFAVLGDSSDLSQGQRVIAIGSALGDFRNTVTEGIVSGLGRSLDTENDFKLEDLIQTDAAINQGNSGGPLIDLRGNVIGINSAIVGRASSGSVVAEGLGFAIAANTVRSVAEQIISTGLVARPYLGIGYEGVTPQLASYYGLSVNRGILVTTIASKSPAALAGLQVGDVILRIADQDLDDNNPYLNALMRHHPGEKVALAVNRSGQNLSIEVTLGQRQQS